MMVCNRNIGNAAAAGFCSTGNIGRIFIPLRPASGRAREEEQEAPGQPHPPFASGLLENIKESFSKGTKAARSRLDGGVSGAADYRLFLLSII